LHKPELQKPFQKADRPYTVGFALLRLRGLSQKSKNTKKQNAKYRSRKFLTDRHSFSAAFWTSGEF